LFTQINIKLKISTELVPILTTAINQVAKEGVAPLADHHQKNRKTVWPRVFLRSNRAIQMMNSI